jgi:hypothetical protein
MSRLDHPVIVGIGLFGALITIIVFITGRDTLVQFFGLSDVPFFSPQRREIVTKSPKELTTWVATITDPIDREEQSRQLYYGRRIRVSGNMTIRRSLTGRHLV